MTKNDTYDSCSKMDERMSPQHIAPYVLSMLALYHEKKRSATLQNLIEELGARKSDICLTLSKLQQAGFVDALRMKLTLQGLALALAIRQANLPPLRAATVVAATA